MQLRKSQSEKDGRNSIILGLISAHFFNNFFSGNKILFQLLSIICE